MNPKLSGIWEYMRDLGLCALAHANRHAAYLDVDNGAWAEFSVLQAAHAAEILIKARIAQEHPLLIFDTFPKASANELNIKSLFSNGKTIEWSSLPDRLWATTGIILPNLNVYKRFGELRNGIQHFSPAPSIDTSHETLKFIFSVIDPFINECWNLFAVDYDEDYEPYLYFIPVLLYRQIPFLVSKEAAECYDDWSVNWNDIDENYKRLILDRVEQAKAIP